MNSNRQTEVVITRAQAAGSTSITLRGAVRFLLTHRQRVSPLPLDHNAGWWNPAKQIYLQAERVRKADPEAKRARADAKFRRRWLAKLKREEAGLVKMPATLVEIQSFMPGRPGRRAKLDELFRLRGIAGVRGNHAVELPVFDPATIGCAVIPCGLITAVDARHAGLELDRGVFWKITPAVWSGITKNSYSESEHGRRGWKTVSWADHRAVLRSCAMPDKADPQNLLCVFGDQEFSVRLTDGRWELDANGIKAVIGPDDFHPTMEDLRAKDAPARIARLLASNAETRRRLAAERAAEAAETEGVFVCVADSVRAGNCLAGTQQFAARHNLKVDHHYHAPELLQISNGDTGRVRLAVRAAVNRHRMEVERGYAVLAEHGIGGAL